MGSSAGALATAAGRAGVTIETYGLLRSAGLKWCYRCRAWHPLTAFAVDRSRGDGLMSACSVRRSSRGVAPGPRHRAALAAQGLAWCSGCRQWADSADIKQGRCGECTRTAAREWYARNRREVSARKIARKRGLGRIPIWWRDQATADLDGRCSYGCGREATTLDHVWPVARGGKSTPGNLAPACLSCNSSKRAFLPGPWVDRGFTAYPHFWTDLASLAWEHGTDDWMDVA